jgi:hypothetical protein
MNPSAACLSALIILSGASNAGAGPVADAAARAEALQAEGKTVEALEALGGALDTIWAEGPLAFRKVALVESAGPLGTYEERAERSFTPDEMFRVYVEPVGFGYGSAGANGTIGFDADLAIENPTGQVITEAKDVFAITVDSAPGRREFGMTLSFAVPYLRPGDYEAIFTVRDKNSEKTGAFEVPFSVDAPAADAGPAAEAQPEGTSGGTGQN